VRAAIRMRAVHVDTTDATWAEWSWDDVEVTLTDRKAADDRLYPVTVRCVNSRSGRMSFVYAHSPYVRGAS